MVFQFPAIYTYRTSNKLLQIDNTYAIEKYMTIENMFKAQKYQNNYYYWPCNVDDDLKTADARFLYQDIKVVYHKCGYMISICLFDYLSNALLKMVG